MPATFITIWCNSQEVTESILSFCLPTCYQVRTCGSSQRNPADRSSQHAAGSDCSLHHVTYPEALAEKVISREVLKENTLKISVGERLDNMFVSDVLDEYGFEQVDYVYEPGQYAMRGSILDVFSFSYEFPYRIDFFGNEVETIRSFDVETQLSKEKLDSIYIVPEMTKGNRTNSSLLDSLPSETLLASKDMAWVKERIGSIWNEEPIIGDEESFANIEQLRAKLITGEDFLHAALGFCRLHFGTRPM